MKAYILPGIGVKIHVYQLYKLICRILLYKEMLVDLYFLNFQDLFVQNMTIHSHP